MGLRSGNKGKDAFVVVSYDFEYITEEGKEVWMKEGEVLLLLSKTNGDWWQVIRRGDRRPFYAPARYVMEVKSDQARLQGDWESHFSGETTLHYRPDNGEPLPTRLETQNRAHFTTFGHAPLPIQAPVLHNKRASYSPAGAVTGGHSHNHGGVGGHHHGPQSSDFLFGAPRFQERYRSNSMDSILVEQERHTRQPVFVQARQEGLRAPPGMLLGGPGPPVKRPTFDQLDKRASWSADRGMVAPGPHPPSQFLASSTRPHPNNMVSHPNNLAHHPSTLPNKKPVPLPRSKIPVPTALPSRTTTIDRSQPQQPEMRTFKRSKTDLSLNMLSNYKAGRAAAAGLDKKDESRRGVVPQLRPRPSTSRAARPTVITEESLGPASLAAVANSRDPTSVKEERGKEEVKEKGFTKHKGGKQSSRKDTPLKPAVASKPSLKGGGGGKAGHGKSEGESKGAEETNTKGNNNSSSRGSSRATEQAENRLLGRLVGGQVARVRSESDLVTRVESEAALRLEEELKVSVKVENVSSAAGSNGVGSKRLEVELPERKSSETRSDILGDPPTLRKSSREGELTSNRKSHERKVHDSEALRKAKETEALRKAKESAHEQEHEAVKKKEAEERVNEEALKVRKAAEELSERKRSLERVLEKENVVPTPNITTNASNSSPPNLNKSLDNKKLNVGKNSSHVTNERFLDMEEPLPEPPPTPKRSSSPIEISAPLIISTEPMSVSSSSVNKSVEDKSNCSTSFDSLDGSLDSGSGGWPEGGDWLGSEPHRDSVQSPGNSSTCSRSPPSPVPGATPTRHVMTDWDEFMEPNSGRKFYYNAKTHEKSWKPPRRTARCSTEGHSAPTSPDPYSDKSFDLPEVDTVEQEEIVSEKKDSGILDIIGDCGVGERVVKEKQGSLTKKRERPSEVPEELVEEADQEVRPGTIPHGYEVRQEEGEGGETYFVNMFTGLAWYTAKDRNGRVYYYEENGNESCWSLPNVGQSIQDHSIAPSPVPDKAQQEAAATALAQEVAKQQAKDEEELRTKTDNLRQKFYHSNSNIQLGDTTICVVKQGSLHKTRLSEGGKKYRKNWVVSNVVLTDSLLLFFKDSKAFLEKGQKPEHCVDLKGASIEWCQADKSKRSNVFEVGSCVLEQHLLLQDDDFTLANDWFCRIENVIVSLSQKELVDGPMPEGMESASSTLRKGDKKSGVLRTKSMKLKLLPAGEEGVKDQGGLDSPAVVTAPMVKEKLKIREKLRKFFLRRPNVEDLMKRGIMKNEPVFGSTLLLLARQDHSEVPLFVQRCISIIESRPEYLSTDGVYRQSGNLSVVQRLRLQIDQGNLAVLDSVDDVHVLTGALKLFFRELQEPLIPWEAVEKLLAAVNLPSKKAKLKQLKEIISRFPSPHRATLFSLLSHLEKVTGYREVNRMAVANLAIVFGPTLMWPPAHLTTTNMALNMMQQNMIVESLITNLASIS